MPVKLRVKGILKTRDIQSRLDKARKKAQFALDNQVLKDSNYFVPMSQEKNLEKSSIVNSQVGKGIIQWSTPYARRLYYNPQYNFSKDHNPNARGLWFEHAKAERLQDWVEVAQKAIEENF